MINYQLSETLEIQGKFGLNQDIIFQNSETRNKPGLMLFKVITKKGSNVSGYSVMRKNSS